MNQEVRKSWLWLKDTLRKPIIIIITRTFSSLEPTGQKKWGPKSSWGIEVETAEYGEDMVGVASDKRCGKDYSMSWLKKKNSRRSPSTLSVSSNSLYVY